MADIKEPEGSMFVVGCSSDSDDPSRGSDPEAADEMVLSKVVMMDGGEEAQVEETERRKTIVLFDLNGLPCPENVFTLIFTLISCPEKYFTLAFTIIFTLTSCPEKYFTLIFNLIFTLIFTLTSCPEKYLTLIFTLIFTLTSCPEKYLTLIFTLTSCPEKYLTLIFTLTSCPEKYLTLIFTLTSCPEKYFTLIFLLPPQWSERQGGKPFNTVKPLAKNGLDLRNTIIVDNEIIKGVWMAK
eukprot:gene23079-30271_t